MSVCISFVSVRLCVRESGITQVERLCALLDRAGARWQQELVKDAEGAAGSDDGSGADGSDDGGGATSEDDLRSEASAVDFDDALDATVPLDVYLVRG